MALKEYQSAITKSKLYEASLLGGISGRGATLNASIWANDTISIYGSDSATEPENLADMTLDAENTDVSGTLVFGSGVSAIPRYIAVTGDATEIIASGLELTEIGDIS